MTYHSKKSLVGKCLFLFLAAILLLAATLSMGVFARSSPGESDFSLSVTDIPDTMRVGESLTVIGTLHFSPQHSYDAAFDITPLFIAFNGEDRTFGYTGEADHHFPSGGETSARRIFTPEVPGTHTIRVTADFSIDGKAYHYEEDHTVTVTE